MIFTKQELEGLLKRTAKVAIQVRMDDGWGAGTAELDGWQYPCYAQGEGSLPVVAYGRREDGSSVLVCSAGRPIKPELQQAFGRKELGTAWNCQYEHSCGALLVVKGERPTRYLVIQGMGGHIGFPKGHIEPGEGIEETVARELREEVGVTEFEYVDGFRVDLEVVTRKKRKKTVTYFLAEFDPARNVLERQEEEIRTIRLLGYEEAREWVNTELDKELLDKAEALLEERV